nr:transcriptional regulator FeaR [uncultured Rhodoferax sp.]
MNSYLRDFDDWYSRLRQACGQIEASPAHNQSIFVGDVVRQDLDGLGLTRIRTNAGHMMCPGLRQHHSTDARNDSHCFLVLQQSGRSRLVQSGISIDLSPGEIAYMDASDDCEIIPVGLMEHVSIHLDRQQVQRLLPEKLHHIGKLSRNSTSGRLLHMLVGQICTAELSRPASCGDGAAIEDALIALLGPALEQADERSDLVHDPRLEKCLLEQAKKYIEASLADPCLSPLKVAKRLNISLRRLYRLFEAQDGSVSRYIQQARLRGAAMDLGNFQLREKSVTEIAYTWGFTDSAHFSRSFKKQFEVAPRDYRAQTLQ